MTEGPWMLSEEAREWIYKNIPVGSTIVELGSGEGSRILSEKYTVYSIEHDKRWVGKYDKVNYIYAPLVDNSWYDVAVLIEELPQKCELIIVDGPPESRRRVLFEKFIDLFDKDAIILLDDIHRLHERFMFMRLGEGHRTKRFPGATMFDKMFGIIRRNKK